MIVAPNTPKTSWIKDNGTTLETTTDVLVDESGNFFVDESGNNLLDSVSTDGDALSHSWANTDQSTAVQWIDALNNDLASNADVERETESGVTRITEQGTTRILEDGANRLQQPTSWTEDEYA